MPPSRAILTNSSAPAWSTVLRALKSPLPSPNVMVPKQSFETKRPVSPSVAYFMSVSFRSGLFGRPRSEALGDHLFAFGPERLGVFRIKCVGPDAGAHRAD